MENTGGSWLLLNNEPRALRPECCQKKRSSPSTAAPLTNRQAPRGVSRFTRGAAGRAWVSHAIEANSTTYIRSPHTNILVRFGTNPLNTLSGCSAPCAQGTGRCKYTKNGHDKLHKSCACTRSSAGWGPRSWGSPWSAWISTCPRWGLVLRPPGAQRPSVVGQVNQTAGG